MIVCDVWGGFMCGEHLARYILPIEEALVWAKQELEAGFLVNLRMDAEFGPQENFDLRPDRITQ